MLGLLPLTTALTANLFNATTGVAVTVGDDHGCMDGQTDYRWCPCHHRCENNWDDPANACCTGSIVNSSCSWKVPAITATDTVYDMSYFAGKTFQVTDTYTGDADAASYVYTFGVCTTVKAPSPECDSQTALPPSTAYQTCKVNNPSCQGTCNSLGVIDNNENSLTDPNNPAGGITITYKGGTPCPNGVGRTFTIEFVCNNDYMNIPDSEPVVEPASCAYKVTVKSAYACPARCVMGQNGKQCSGNGVCGYDQKLGSFCQCFGGFEGNDCSTPVSGVDLAHYCGPGTTWTSYKPDCGPCNDDDCEVSLGCCILGYTPTPVPQPTPAPEACSWLVPSSTGFYGTTYDLGLLPPGTLSNGKPGYNVSNGYRDSTSYDYIFGVCAEVELPDTPGCSIQTDIPPKAAAYQVGVWNDSDTSLWATTCNSIGDIAQSEYKLIDEKNPVLGVTVTWIGGTAVGCPTTRKLSVSFVCNPDYHDIRPVQTIQEESTCHYTIEIKTAYGCPAQCKRGKNGLLCSGKGACGYNPDLKQAMCTCDPAWAGPDCSEKKVCSTSKVCAGTAAGSVLGTMAAVGLAGFVFVKRGGRMPGYGSSGSSNMQSLRAPALEQDTGSGRPVDMAAEYSQL